MALTGKEARHELMDFRRSDGSAMLPLARARARVRQLIRERIEREMERSKALGVESPELVTLLRSLMKVNDCRSFRIMLDVTKGM